MRKTIWSWIFFCSALIAAPKSVLIITDAEGVAGICRQEQVEPTDAELRQLLTGEVNAAVQGFLDGGFEEVLVWDGHDGSRTLSAATIHPKAKLVIGNLGRTMTLNRRYTAVAFVGQHSMANVRAGIMAHSYSSLGIQNLLVNGRPMGEIGTRVALAGWFGIPVIFLSGDRAAVEEMRALVADAELVEVKEGLARYSCISLSAEEARQRIRRGCATAAGMLERIKPLRIEGPVSITIEYTTRNSLPIDAELAPGAKVLDDRTIRYEGANFLEAWLRAGF
jgi:D-amino peptidase